MIKLKRIILLVCLSLLLVSSVSASSINGNYKGYSIIKLVDGYSNKEIKSPDVPAIEFNNRTMVPISMLKSFGISVTWDQKTQSATVYSNDQNIQIQKTQEQADSISNIYNAIKQNYGDGLVLSFIDGKEYAIISFYQISDFDTDWSNYYDNLWKALIKTNQDYLRIVYMKKGTSFDYVSYSIKRSILQNFYNGKIDKETLLASWIVQLPSNSTSSSSVNSNAPGNTLNYPSLHSNDGKTYLGKLTTNKYDDESVFNAYGDYGSKFSDKSIWDQFGTYGSKFSDESAFNNLASKPPIIILNGKIIGHLTTNSVSFSDAISPYGLNKWLSDLGY